MSYEMTKTSNATAPWILLAFTLPTKAASARVEIWRKLKRYGALPLKGSGHLLPNTPANQERFQWLSSSIRKSKGTASVLQVQSIADISHDEVVRQFVELRSGQYEALLRQIKAAKSDRSRLPGLKRQLQNIIEVDFFHSPLRQKVEALLMKLEGGDDLPTKRGLKERKHAYVNRTWITRPRPGIDRVGSAWLIQTFIDSNARFIFDDDPGKHKGAVPFDMFQKGGFGHRGDDCTFETLIREFRIVDRRVHAIAQMVHDADLEDEKFGRMEAVGLDKVLVGWAISGATDQELLKRGIQLFEGLFRSLPQ